MSSCTLTRSRFLHFPKTGGWWVCHALTAAGIEIEKADPELNGGHLGYDFGDCSLPAFGFVRNPFCWYESLYSYLVSIDWEYHPDTQASSLNGFVETVLDDNTSIRPMSKWMDDFLALPEQWRI